MIDFTSVKSITIPSGSVAKILDATGNILWQKPPSYDAVFANNTWEQIIDACQKNKVPDTWKIGNTKTLTINGFDAEVVIIGTNCDYYTNGGGTKAPLTFHFNSIPTEFVSKMELHSYDWSADGWPLSLVRRDFLENIRLSLPSIIRNNIRKVNKTSFTMCGLTEDVGFDVTSDDLFLLAEWEVFKTANLARGLEGTNPSMNHYSGNTPIFYQYYERNKNLDIAPIKTDSSGDRVSWWLRSADNLPMYDDGKGTQSDYCLVTRRGNLSSTDGYYDENHVIPAFCF